MDDLVKRLQYDGVWHMHSETMEDAWKRINKTAVEAAARIEALKADRLALRNEVLEEVAMFVAGYPARAHGWLAAEPGAAAEQAAKEIVSGIRALKHQRTD